jgi:hypothetical protein
LSHTLLARAKTDRLDAAMLMRVFLGWLRGERGHCGMVAIPTMEEEDARPEPGAREPCQRAFTQARIVIQHSGRLFGSAFCEPDPHCLIL